MRRHEASPESVSLRAKAALTVIAAAVAMVGMTRLECPVGEFFCVALRVAVDVLPSTVLAAWHAWQVPGCDHSWAPGLLQISGACWPVILGLAGV